MGLITREPGTIDLSSLGHIPATYLHHQRRVTLGAPLILPGSILKWYDLHLDGITIPIDEAVNARALVRAAIEAGEVERGHGLGFVVFHYSTAYAYLLVCTWYQVQELWLTLFVRDLSAGTGYERKRPGENWSAACVWELAPIWHERQAWTAFLHSSRDEAAKRHYLGDVLSGLI